jgi:hypothetical protein
MIDRYFYFTDKELLQMPVLDRIKKVFFDNELDVIDIPRFKVKVGRRTVYSVQYVIIGAESKIRVYDKDDYIMTPSIEEWNNIATALESWSKN